MRRRFGQISKDGTNGPTTNRSPRRKGIVATLVASDNILHGQSPQVYATHPASLEEPHTVETRVVLLVVVGKIGCHFVAEAPPSRGDVLLDNGRLCFVGFSCQHCFYPFKVCCIVSRHCLLVRLQVAVVYLFSFKRCCLLVQLQVRLFTWSASSVVVSYECIIPSLAQLVKPKLKLFLPCNQVRLQVQCSSHHHRRSKSRRNSR